MSEGGIYVQKYREFLEMSTMTLYRSGHPPLPGSSVIDWLMAGRSDTIQFRARAVQAEGWVRSMIGIPWFGLGNRFVRVPSPTSAFTRFETILGLAIASLFLYGATSDTTVAEATPVPEKPIVIEQIIPTPVADITARPELGQFSDPSYPYPHQRIELGYARPTAVTFSGFHGIPVGKGWYSRYLGVQGKIPQTTIVNINADRTRMFQVKFKRFPDSTPVARGMEGQFAEMYNTQRTYLTLPQYITGVGQVMSEVKTTLDWDGLCAEKRIDVDGCLTLQQIVGLMTPEMLVAYGNTELFAEDKRYKGVFNAWALDHGLTNYGREHWDLTPAQSDKLASGGLWQFTCYAIGAYIDEKGQPQIGGATIVGRHAGFKKESFLDLVRSDHERVAFFFAIDNVARLVQTARRHDVAYSTLRLVWLGYLAESDPVKRAELRESSRSELLEFIAVSHHAPNGVREKFAMPWLMGGAKKPFYSYLSGRFKPYAKRTRYNYPGLKQYLSDPGAAMAAVTKRPMVRLTVIPSSKGGAS